MATGCRDRILEHVTADEAMEVAECLLMAACLHFQRHAVSPSNCKDTMIHLYVINENDVYLIDIVCAK